MTYPLETRGLAYSVEEHFLLKDVNLRLNPGEMLGIVGPNGAGKTSLIRCLSGYYKPTEGEILLNGTALEKINHRHRAQKISYISQESSLLLPYRVMEVLLMGSYPQLGLWTAPQKELLHRAGLILRNLGLEEMEHREYSGLSGGEKQLVLFGRSILQNSGILLMDEPSSNLDLRHEMELLRGAKDLCEQGKSVVISMHNLDRASQFCDRILLMSRGSIFREGTAREVLTRENLEQVYGTSVEITENQQGSLHISPKI